MNRRRETASPLHLNIGRIVVDADALGKNSRANLHADIGSALSRHLSGEILNGPPTLAQQIAGTVAPHVRARLPKGGRNGA